MSSIKIREALRPRGSLLLWSASLTVILCLFSAFGTPGGSVSVACAQELSDAAALTAEAASASVEELASQETAQFGEAPVALEAEQGIEDQAMQGTALSTAGTEVGDIPTSLAFSTPKEWRHDYGYLTLGDERFATRSGDLGLKFATDSKRLSLLTSADLSKCRFEASYSIDNIARVTIEPKSSSTLNYNLSIRIEALGIGSTDISISCTYDDGTTQLHGTLSLPSVQVLQNEGSIESLEANLISREMEVIYNTNSWANEKVTYNPSFAYSPYVLGNLLENDDSARVCGLIIAKTNMTVPLLDDPNELFDISYEGSSFTSVTIAYEDFSNSLNMSQWEKFKTCTAFAVKYSLKRSVQGDVGVPAVNTITVALKSDPSIKASFEVLVTLVIPKIDASDQTLKVGDSTFIGNFNIDKVDASSDCWRFMSQDFDKFFGTQLKPLGYVQSVTSSNPSVLEVNKVSSSTRLNSQCPFTFTALATGTATVTLKDRTGCETSFVVTVVSENDDARVESIALSSDSLTIRTTDLETRLSATIVTSDGSIVTPNWASSDSARIEIRINEDGSAVLIPKSVGECIVTATAGDKAAACTVKIEAGTIAPSAEGSDLQAAVSVPTPLPEEVLNDLSGVSLSIKKLPAKAEDFIGADGQKQIVKQVYEINLLDVGNGSVRPWNSMERYGAEHFIDVRIKMDDELKSLVAFQRGRPTMYYVNGDVREQMTTWVDGDYLVFRTSHFSQYALTFSEDEPASSNTQPDSANEGALPASNATNSGSASDSNASVTGAGASADAADEASSRSEADGVRDAANTPVQVASKLPVDGQSASSDASHDALDVPATGGNAPGFILILCALAYALASLSACFASCRRR